MTDIPMILWFMTIFFLLVYILREIDCLKEELKKIKEAKELKEIPKDE